MIPNKAVEGFALSIVRSRIAAAPGIRMHPATLVIGSLEKIPQVVGNSVQARHRRLHSLIDEIQLRLGRPLRCLLDGLEDQFCFGRHALNRRQSKLGRLLPVAERTASHMRAMP